MSTVVDSILSSEKLARFAPKGKNHFRSDGTVKHQAFDPERYQTKDGLAVETSVSRIDNCADSKIWAMGDNAFKNRGRTACGYSCILAGDVFFLELMVKIDEPPRHHAVISNWPDELQIEFKIKLLASKAFYVHRA